MSLSHQPLLAQISGQEVDESYEDIKATALLEDTSEFTYEWGLLVRKTGKLTASIKASIDNEPSVGRTSHIVVTSEILRDENYDQFDRNMGTVWGVEPYFLENVAYLLVPKDSATITGGQVEYWEEGAWHLVDQNTVLDNYESRDSEAAHIILTIMKMAAQYAFGFSDFIHIYRKPDIEIPDNFSFPAVPFIEHREGTLGSYNYIRPLKLRTIYTVEWLRTGKVPLRLMLRSAHHVRNYTSEVSKRTPQLTREYYLEGIDVKAEEPTKVAILQLVGSLAGGDPQDVAVQGDYAYVAAEGILSILDVSNPRRPKQVAWFDTPGEAQTVFVQGKYVYVADYGAGPFVFEFTAPVRH